MNYYEDYAQSLLNLGYEPIPLNGKRPVEKDWVAKPIEINEVAYGTCNVGVRTGLVCALDVDVTDEGVARELYLYIKSLGFNHLRTRFGAKPKFLIPFLSPDPLRRKAVSNKWQDRDGNFHMLEVLGKGQQFVVYGRHPTGSDYKWLQDRDLVSPSVDVQDLPLFTEDVQTKIMDKFNELASAAGWTNASPTPSASSLQVDKPAAEAPIDMSPQDIHEMLDKLVLASDEYSGYDAWLQMGMALHHQFDGSPTGFDIWDKVCQNLYNYDFNELQAKWASFDENRSKTITMRTLVKAARGQGISSTVSAQDFPDLEEKPQTGTDETQKGDTTVPKSWMVDLDTAINAPAPRSIVKGLIGHGQAIAITAKPKTGKTLFGLELARCIITGDSFFDLEVRDPGPVLYLSYEGPESITQRVMALATKFTQWGSFVDGFAHGMPPKRLAASSPKEMQQTLVQLLKDAKAKFGCLPRLVVLDTLAASSDMDENSSRDMGNLTSTVRRMLDKYKMGFIYVHHSTKGNVSLRGHSSLEGDVDGIIDIDIKQDSGTSVATLQSHRWYPPGKVMFYKAEHIPTGRMDEDGDVEEAPILVPVAGVIQTKSKPTMDLVDRLVAWFSENGNTVLEGGELLGILETWEVSNGLDDSAHPDRRKKAKQRAWVMMSERGWFKLERNGSGQVRGVQKGTVNPLEDDYEESTT